MPRRALWFAVVALLAVQTWAGTYKPSPRIGLPAGLIPHCPGVLKNASISNSAMPRLQVMSLRTTDNGVLVKKNMPITAAAKMILKENSYDFKTKKTVLYAVGFFDSAWFPFSQAVAGAYARRGYNVFISETFHFLTNIYPKSARISRVIGNKIGDFLVDLTNQGLAAENLELVGISLGSHIAAYAAKRFYTLTGVKPSRLTGLDPAGPCFRSLPAEYRFDRTDAEKVEVVHTNIDGFGIAEPLGHIDYYVNGGEFQPGDIPFIPCLVICSHLRSMLYWWQSLEHPKKFIAVKCDSVEDARLAQCYNNTEINYLGLEARFDRPGIFYLGTGNEFPYYRGKEGLKAENEIYTSVSRKINDDDNFVV